MNDQIDINMNYKKKIVTKVIYLVIIPFLIFILIASFISCDANNVDAVSVVLPQYKCTPCNLDCDTIIFNQPGTCPHCNMALVPIEELEDLDNFTIEETTFINDSLHLVADIFIPKDPSSQKIGVCLIQGSGHSGKDNLWALEHAEFLAARGYYVLLPDKRGVGGSEGDWRYTSYEDLAWDAIMSYRHLMSKYGLTKVGLVGLSEGGRLAPHAAALDSTIDFIANICSSTLELEEKLIQEMTNTARQEGLSPEEIAEMLYLHVLLFEYTKTNDWAPLKTYYESLKESNWSEFAATFPNTPDHHMFDFIKNNIHHDPLPFYKQLEQDVFVAFGSKDEKDNVPVYVSTYRLQSAYHQMGKDNYEIHIYPAGHSLRDSLTGRLMKEYKDDLYVWLQQQ